MNDRSTSPDNDLRSQPKPRSLFNISEDLEKLNEILDEAGDDAQQQELLSQWFAQLGEERDRKLDAYAALIAEMLARAEVRKTEAKRLMELAAADEQRARLLKERLKWFFETHHLKTVETARYRLSIAKNGGKAPLILKSGIAPQQLPRRFQTVSIEPNTNAIRAALEAGEDLDLPALASAVLAYGSSSRDKFNPQIDLSLQNLESFQILEQTSPSMRSSID